jgi:hypothetical protein
MKACRADFGVAEVKPRGLKNVGYRADFGVAEVKPVQLKPVLSNTFYLNCSSPLPVFEAF